MASVWLGSSFEATGLVNMLRAMKPALSVGTTLSVRSSSQILSESPFDPHMAFCLPVSLDLESQ